MAKKFLKIGSSKPAYYQNILMRSNPDLHEEAAQVLFEYCEPGAKVIDVGAGQGAFSQRLHDLGFDVTSVDIDPNDFKAKDVNFVKVDFDRQEDVAEFVINNKDKYDVVIGMEVIEHVENPWDYFRLLKSLAKDSGILLVTTPNIQSWYSRLLFTFGNTFFHFSDSDYLNSGHINPISIGEMLIISKSINLEHLYSDTLCHLPTIWISRNTRTTVFSIINILFGWSFGENRLGDISIVVLKKKD